MNDSIILKNVTKDFEDEKHSFFTFTISVNSKLIFINVNSFFDFNKGFFLKINKKSLISNDVKELVLLYLSKIENYVNEKNIKSKEHRIINKKNLDLFFLSDLSTPNINFLLNKNMFTHAFKIFIPEKLEIYYSKIMSEGEKLIILQQKIIEIEKKIKKRMNLKL